jgi:predicted transcriptional regulator
MQQLAATYQRSASPTFHETALAAAQLLEWKCIVIERFYAPEESNIVLLLLIYTTAPVAAVIGQTDIKLMSS